jgi:hypothetical protein
LFPYWPIFTDDIWTGGSKDIQQISNWKWATNSANDKNNIANVGYYLDGSILYFFADRFANNGDSSIGFWILQSPISKAGATGGTFSGTHQNGDLLIISNFSNGGTQPNFFAYQWLNGALSTTPIPIPSFGADVAVNTTNVSSPSQWNYIPKGGVAGGEYKPNTFFEGKIDLAIFSSLNLNACFGTFLVETRNSTSITAALEDVVLGPFGIVPTCEIIGASTVCPSSAVTFSAPAGGTYVWSIISGNATIQGSTSSQTVTVLPGNCGSSFTLGLTLTNQTGCTSSCSRVISAQDTTNPSIDTESANETVECDGDGNQAQLAAWLNSNGGAAASDVCSGVMWSNNFTALSDDCGATGSATVTFRATDDCGNYSETTATFTIEDTTNPSIDTESANETVECDGDGNQAQLAAWLASNGGASASDACSGVEWSNDFVSFSGVCGSVEVTFTATDACGNSSDTVATFTINPIAIVPNCPDDFTAIDCEEAGAAEFTTWIASFSYTGGCGKLTATDLSGYVFPEPGQWVTITYTVTDECGQSESCTATFTTPLCFDGCTLGYWKNQTENWCPEYSTTTSYGSVFVNAPAELSGLSLLQVLNVTGGGIYNLGRQSVAALLNICHEDVNYSSPYTNDIALLISDVNAAFLAGGSAPGALGSQLDILNQVGCSIDANGNPIEDEPTEEPIDGTAVKTISSTDASNMFVVYPVPFKDNITLKYKFAYDSSVTVEIFNMTGVLVHKYVDTKAYQSEEEVIAMNFKADKGQMFILRVTTDRETSTQTIIKARF